MKTQQTACQLTKEHADPHTIVQNELTQTQTKTQVTATSRALQAERPAHTAATAG